MALGKILVVEDDQSLRRVMQGQIEKAGYEAAVAADVPQALEIIQRESQDVVITDLNLPSLSGLELLKTIRAEYPDATVVIMTAYGPIGSAVEAMKFGAYDYLTKPVH